MQYLHELRINSKFTMNKRTLQQNKLQKVEKIFSYECKEIFF